MNSQHSLYFRLLIYSVLRGFCALFLRFFFNKCLFLSLRMVRICCIFVMYSRGKHKRIKSEFLERERRILKMIRNKFEKVSNYRSNVLPQ